MADDINLNLGEFEESDSAKFTCPNCGEVTRDDVVFLCNSCSQEDLIYKDGIYMCPACLNPGDNFECMKCGTKKVSLTFEESSE